MRAGPARLTGTRALGSFRDSTVRILRHPANRGRRGRALVLYVTWQVWERVVRRPWTIRLGTARRLRLHPHQTVAALVLYCQVPDYEEMSFVRDYLRSGDLFVDVGANVGVYSLWASDVDGVDVIAFEPSTVAHHRIVENIEQNGLSARVQVRRKAVGAEKAEVRLTTGLDAVNHVLAAGAAPGACTETVEQTTIDDELEGRTPALIKIDVEGAELEVLGGAHQTLISHRPPLLIEVNDPEGLRGLLADLGYEAWSYDPGTRTLGPSRPGASLNVLALADVEQARARLAQPTAHRPTPRRRARDAPVYARSPVATGSVSPPEPRTRLPMAVKTVLTQHVPLVRLALLRRDLLRSSGWARSGRAGAPVAGDGTPLPWYTYPAIHFLESRLRTDMTVFEYGSGHSTLWWSQRVARVTAVESDPEWVARLTPRLPPNAELLHRPANASGRYAATASECGRRFDVVVIDGEDRAACALACLPALADDGVIVWDNADWTALWADGMEQLQACGFRRVDLRGLGPLNWYEWTTTVFYRPGHNCFDI